jgi:hypothetical protein
MQQIKKSKTFQSDLARYSVIIESMPEGPIRTEVNRLLSSLIVEVRKMDEMHTEMIYTKQLPSMGQEFREKIGAIRKQLDQKIKEFSGSAVSKKS